MPAAIQLPVPVFMMARPRPRPVLVGRGLSGLGAVTQVLDPTTTATIAGVIQQQEGWYPGSVAYRNNNPGNLIYAGQAGATRGADGFAVFDSYDSGLAALNNQLQLYAGRGLSISDMMNVYAPATQAGNNPTLYASRIASALGVDPSTRLVDLGGASSPATPAAATDVVTDAGVFSLESFGPAGLTSDPLLLGVGAGVLGLVLYAAFRD